MSGLWVLSDDGALVVAALRVQHALRAEHAGVGLPPPPPRADGVPPPPPPPLDAAARAARAKALAARAHEWIPSGLLAKRSAGCLLYTSPSPRDS